MQSVQYREPQEALKSAFGCRRAKLLLCQLKKGVSSSIAESNVMNFLHGRAISFPSVDFSEGVARPQENKPKGPYSPIPFYNLDKP